MMNVANIFDEDFSPNPEEEEPKNRVFPNSLVLKPYTVRQFQPTQFPGSRFLSDSITRSVLHKIMKFVMPVQGPFFSSLPSLSYLFSTLPPPFFKTSSRASHPGLPVPKDMP